MMTADDQGTSITRYFRCLKYIRIASTSNLLNTPYVFVVFVESNISSFMLEMKETAFICRNATSRSLILLDELGRATSNEDGVAIAWAVAECLLAKGAMTYFVSHYPQLCQMSRIYPSVQNQHLQASISTNNEETEILYSHKIASGPCQADSNYGIDMAISCGWPSDVLKEVRSYNISCE